MSGRQRGSVLLVAVSVVVVSAAAAAGGYFAVHEFRLHRVHVARPVVSSTPSALSAATSAPPAPDTSTSAPVPLAAEVARALGPRIADPALGGHVVAYVADAATGSTLYSHAGAVAAAPASTAKLLTAAALLAVAPPTHRITTKVVTGSTPGTVVLVGGGDPTLTAATGTHPGSYPDAARISDLAAQLRAAHVRVTRVVVDDSLFTGPTVSPAWAAQDVPSDYAAPITAVMADGGRADPANPIRSTTPDLDAGRHLAAALGANVPVLPGRAPVAAVGLAYVASPPISELIEQMLQQSDNVIAECLARQVALARSAPASFTGAAAAIHDVLAGLGADPGTGMYDGSGLAASDRISAVRLVGVLRLVVGEVDPVLHDIVTELPVAAWRGTLADRYLAGSAAAAGAGVVRAKTGTLTGVSSLAGIVHDTSGRQLVFAVIADQVPDGVAATARADAALDQVAATLAGCGCD